MHINPVLKSQKLHNMTSPFYVYLILTFAIFYNAVLAIVNQWVAKVSFIHALAAEALVIAVSIIYIAFNARLTSQFKKTLIFFCLFILIYLINNSLAMAVGDGPSLKPIRDTLIIFIFILLGHSAAQSNFNLERFMTILAILVSFFLLLELLNTELYLSIFNISNYYFNTRGTGEDVDLALFHTADSFDGRFTFGFREAQRLSSLFLEQTTHANFAVVTSVYLASSWKTLNTFSKATLITTVLLIILGTDSRQALGICILIFLGYYFFPLLNRYTLYLYMPAALLFMFVFFYDPSLDYRTQDNFSGRLTYSVGKLLDADLAAVLGARLSERVTDSGYAYFLYTQSIFGLLAFYFFLPFSLPYDSVKCKRLAHSTMIFFTANLAVSGSTIFSIKTAALLWFIIGLMYSRQFLAGHLQSRQLANK